ncbi:murein DD-endopeptidase MepM/ murein hydrolase activator NlpD [Arthrobacter pascens]|uniref:M23 family metallopeptidase n=1 Tax=Arthrobacter pascens TaxID=1677 RepID=UPI00285834DB|nr:M23 family metallopeptidase [Arthrobacter pascens]MDR6557185.1 murein DD-endopeptidase MepM/ murein hydrolase activator NlpD [Arthrobacter pascens]
MKIPALPAVLLLAAMAAAPSAAPSAVPSGTQYAAPEELGAAYAAPPAPSWSWPLAPRPPVLRPFDPPDKPWLSGHRGVDLKAASDGGPVTSPESGTVSFVGVVVDRPVITVDHGNGLRSSFEPVRSSLAQGDAVAKGDVLGALVTGHCGATPCVHWGVRRGDEYLNPLEFVLDLRPSVLLPLAGE